MDKRDYLQFGNLKLPVMGGLYSFSGKKGYDYAQYDIAEGKPMIRPVGEKLRTISESIMLRRYLGDDINGTIDIVDKMLESGEPYDLIFTNGFYKGKYYITDIQDRVENTLPTGEILEYDFTIELTEYSDRAVVTQNVQSNSKHKNLKGTISQRDKTKKMNQSMPPNTKLKK